MKTIVCIIATAIGLAVPAFAHASPAYLTEDVGLMAGPAQGYPLVDDLQAGDAVDVRGCTDGWTWCDVVTDGERGWVPGDALEMDDGGQWYPVPEYAPSYGIPVVVFSIQSYWPAYYSYYPVYVDRWSWYRWQPPYVVPLPHPIFGSNGNPPPRVVPLPHP
ncbi:MAG: SH3 domain-containing protein, partial [Proteobacteria bacterium]|nr:SH3 domain-containing protein [Pseudomonadota bacterium]